MRVQTKVKVGERKKLPRKWSWEQFKRFLRFTHPEIIASKDINILIE